MLELLEVQVGPKNLSYTLKLSQDLGLSTEENREAVQKIVGLMPGMLEHVCISPAGDSFKDALVHTDLAHLLEHMVVEILALSGRVELVCGKTRKLSDSNEGSVFQTVLSCDDDTLTIAAISSALWIMEWALAAGAKPAPNIMAIAEGLGHMLDSIDRVPHTSTLRAR